MKKTNATLKIPLAIQSPSFKLFFEFKKKLNCPKEKGTKLFQGDNHVSLGSKGVKLLWGTTMFPRGQRFKSFWGATMFPKEQGFKLF
jgi:hypothetical protein